MGDTSDWFEITRRNARSVQTTVGWVFWDPGVVERYAELGIPKDFAGPRATRPSSRGSARTHRRSSSR